MGPEEPSLSLAISLGTDAILGRRALNHSESGDYVLWATKQLDEGGESKSVNILAGLEPPYNWFEVQEYFTRALRELQIIEKPRDILIEKYAREIAQNIVDQKISPNMGLDILHHIYLDSENDSKYERWMVWDDYRVNLKAGLDPEGNWNLDLKNFDRKMIEEAGKFLASEEMNQSQES